MTLDGWAKRHEKTFLTLGPGLPWPSAQAVAEAAKAGEIRPADVLALDPPTATGVKNLVRLAKSAESATWYTCLTEHCDRWAKRHKGARACPACGADGAELGTAPRIAVCVSRPRLDRVRSVLGETVPASAPGSTVIAALIDAVCRGDLRRKS